MIAVASQAQPGERTGRRPLFLENGAHLGAAEFLRHYETSPEIKKAELVNGIVYVASPTRLEQHGEPDNLIQVWLGTYGIATPGVKCATNATVRLGPDDVPQPDALLRILEEHGGHSKLTSKDYLEGAPELVAEIAASAASLDAREKSDSYRRAGVREYVLWRTVDKAINWWFLEEDEYHPMAPGSNGIFQSRVFPGLWLDSAAAIAGDGAKVLATLQEGLRSAEHATFLETLKVLRPSK
jgi:Uma2 family endonuclease